MISYIVKISKMSLNIQKEFNLIDILVHLVMDHIS